MQFKAASGQPAAKVPLEIAWIGYGEYTPGKRQLLDSKPMEQDPASDNQSAFIFDFSLMAKEFRLGTAIQMGITDS